MIFNITNWITNKILSIRCWFMHVHMYRHVKNDEMPHMYICVQCNHIIIMPGKGHEV